MLISELIDKLQEIQAKHGDIPALTDARSDGDGAVSLQVPSPLVVRVKGSQLITGTSPRRCGCERQQIFEEEDKK